MAGLLRRGLVEEGYAVDVARTGDDAIWMASAVDYDAIVLDLMLPGVDGIEVCRRARENGVWSPVLMLTARDAVGDRVAGLDAGADDYLPKPFSFAELLARLRALVRRGSGERPVVLEVGDLRLDPATHQVWRGRTEVQLSAKEFSLLEAFMRRPGQVLSRLQLHRARVGLRVREPLERRGRVREVPAGQGRPPVRTELDRDGPRRRAIGSVGRAPHEPASDPGAAGARLRARHGRRVRGGRCDPLRPARRHARRADRRHARGARRRARLDAST